MLYATADCIWISGPGLACLPSCFAQHIGRNESRSDGMTSRSPRSKVHACFLPCRPGPDSACRSRHGCRWSRPAGPWRESSEPHSARRVLPDVDEFLPPHVAAGQRKLHAGKNISIGRDVSQGVTRAAWISFHHVFVRRRRRGAKFLYISHQALIVKYPAQLRAGIRRLRMDVSPSIFGVMVGSRV